jgi:hypothetical protein
VFDTVAENTRMSSDNLNNQTDSGRGWNLSLTFLDTECAFKHSLSNVIHTFQHLSMPGSTAGNNIFKIFSLPLSHCSEYPQMNQNEALSGRSLGTLKSDKKSNQLSIFEYISYFKTGVSFLG